MKINAQKALQLGLKDYPGATKIRACLTYTDSSKSGDGVHVRLRRTEDAGATVFFEDVFKGTWSDSGLIHHDCGQWHDLAQVSCGASWSDSCQIDALHGQGVAMTIYGYDLELGMTYPTQETIPQPRVVGVFDVAASFSGQASASKWAKLSEGRAIGFAFHDYEIYGGSSKAAGTQSVLQVRACAVFTDSSTGKGVFKVQLVTGNGKTLFTDDFGSTFSGSGLIHHECGTWRDAPTECGLGRATPTSCKLTMVHTQGVQTRVWDYDLEVGSTSAQSPFYAGRFHVPLATAVGWTGSRLASSGSSCMHACDCAIGCERWLALACRIMCEGMGQNELGACGVLCRYRSNRMKNSGVAYLYVFSCEVVFTVGLHIVDCRAAELIVVATAECQDERWIFYGRFRNVCELRLGAGSAFLRHVRRLVCSFVCLFVCLRVHACMFACFRACICII